VDRETREFVIDVRVLELPQNWAVGQRAEVYVEAARQPDATLLPAAFVSRHEGQPGVFVRSDGRAAWRPLKLGLRGRETVEVLDGLEPGDVAVKPVDGGTTLRAGRRVKAS
jgi:HlyD family secretion protein